MNMRHVKLISFTARGAALGERIARALPALRCERYARGEDRSLAFTSLARFAQQAMRDCDGLVFIGAAGIAVRAVAPYLQGKASDPAVLVCDEGGRFVVPLLSGHLGGGIALAETLSRALGAQAVITTATDARGVFAVDSWAAAQGLHVCNPDQIQFFSAALLRGEPVGLQSDKGISGDLPVGVTMSGADCGAVISCRTDRAPFAHTLHLVPRAVVAGMGCRRGVSMAALARALDAALAAEAIPTPALAAIATIDVKRDEAGLRALARARGVELLFFTAAQLRAAQGEFSHSPFVESTVGVDNVCERAAVCAGGALLRGKQAGNGVTVALAQRPWEVMF